MAFQSLQNKWLVVREGVILTDVIDPVILQLDPFFEQAQLKAFVTSGLRDAQHQLGIILNLADKNSLNEELFYNGLIGSPIDFKVKWSSAPLQNTYWWQPIWSALLNRGVIVNPPLAAETLMDYYRKDELTGKLVLYKSAGYLIQPSPHFNGTAFDVGGGNDKDISNELAVIREATKDGGIKGFKGLVVERNNNCVHVDAERIAV